MLPAIRTSRWLSLADIIVSRLHPWLIVQCTLHIGVKGMPSRELKYLVLTALIFIETMDDFQANNSERCLNVCDIHGVPSDGINTGWVGARSCSLALLPSSSTLRWINETGADNYCGLKKFHPKVRNHGEGPNFTSRDHGVNAHLA